MLWFKNSRIKHKLLAAYLPLIILPVIVISVTAYALFSYKMDESSLLLADQNANEIVRHLETYLDELDRLSLFPYFHSNVMRVLQMSGRSDVPQEIYQEYKMFDDMFDNIMLNPRKDLLNVFLYRSDGTRYFNSRVYVILNMDYDWQASEWFKRTVEADGGVVYTSNSGRDGRFNLLQHEIFSLSRLIKDENGQTVGTILIDANFQGVEDVLQDIGLGAESNVILSNDEGDILFAKNNLYIDQLDVHDLAHNHKTTFEGESLYIGADHSDKTGWTVSVIIPSSNIYQSFVSIREVIVWLSVVFIAIAILVTYLISASITKPIMQMHRMMKMVESGNYDVELELKSQDEIGSLGRAFNKMSAQIRALIREVYEFEIRQKEAELNNLKMQIRPHFLYNTLEAIRSLAEIQDNHEIKEMTTSLGSILRYSIKTHQKLVLLEKEINYIHQYLNIYRIMNSDAITISYKIEPEINRYYSIPLMFQPVIENALQHGLYGKRQGCLLEISGRREGDDLHFAIMDNGIGIDPIKMNELNRQLADNQSTLLEPSSYSGIGLNNVNRRIKIVFGERYGLTLSANPSGGTIVHIRIPAMSSQSI